MTKSRELHYGSGKYEGLVHDGRHWIYPLTGERARLTPWDRTGKVGKAVVLTVAIVVTVSTGLYIQTVMSAIGG